MPKSLQNFQKLCWNRNFCHTRLGNAALSVTAVVKKSAGIPCVPLPNKNLMQLRQAASRKTSPENDSHLNCWQHPGWGHHWFLHTEQDFGNIWIMQLVPVAVPYHSEASGFNPELWASETSSVKFRYALSASWRFDSNYYRSRSSEGIKECWRKWLSTFGRKLNWWNNGQCPVMLYVSEHWNGHVREWLHPPR